MRTCVTILTAALLLAGCRTTSPGPRPGTPSPASPATSPHGTVTREATEGRDFVVYRGDGTRASLRDVIDRMPDVRAVLVGEEHDDVAGHRVQLDLLTRAYQRHRVEGGRPLVLSLEMFETDVQGVVDEYLAGLITEEHFLASARPWANYGRDYRPLVEFARDQGLPVVAANAPRRYVNRASRLGRDSLEVLPEEALETLPPLPYPEPSERYLAQWDSLMGAAAAHMSGSPLDGQTLWDAAMGHAIAETLERRPGALVLHMAGGFHVEKGTGIPEALQHYRPGTGVLLVAMRSVDDPRVFDAEAHAGRGDFVILTDARWKHP